MEDSFGGRSYFHLTKVGRKVPWSIHFLPLSVVFLPRKPCDLENSEPLEVPERFS